MRSNRSSTRLGSAACSQLACCATRGKTRWHLPCLHAGLKAIPRERRRPRDAAARLAVQLEAITAAADAGGKDHDRWLTSEKPARPKTRRPPRHLKTAGAARLRADPADRLGRHDRGGAEDHAPCGAKPRRRARLARGDREGTISGVGDSLKSRALVGPGLSEICICISDVQFAICPKWHG